MTFPSAPRVSVITPTRNRLRLLQETMDSVQDQRFEAWEHLVVDDGSDDGTAEEVLRRAAGDPRIRYIARQGGLAGANACRNLGLRESRADLIVFLDSDDLLEPQALEGRLAVMGRNQDMDFATFQAGVFKVLPGDLGRELNPELSGDDLLRFLYFECPWQTTAPTWRRSALTRLGGFDETLMSWQDVDLHIRALSSGCHYLRFPAIDHHVRWQFETTKISIEQRVSPSHLDAATHVIRKFEKVVRQGPGMTWIRQRALCSLHFLIAAQWIEQGSTAKALEAWRAVRQDALGSRTLHMSGALLLRCQSLGRPGRWIGGRLAHKWKGLARMRTNAELVAPR